MNKRRPNWSRQADVADGQHASLRTICFVIGYHIAYLL